MRNEGQKRATLLTCCLLGSTFVARRRKLCGMNLNLFGNVQSALDEPTLEMV